MDFPSGRVPEWALERFLVAIEACGGGTPDLGLFLEVLRFIGGVGVRNKSGGPRGWGNAPTPLGMRPYLMDDSETPPDGPTPKIPINIETPRNKPRSGVPPP